MYSSDKFPVFIGYSSADEEIHCYGLPIEEYPGLLKVGDRLHHHLLYTVYRELFEVESLTSTCSCSHSTENIFPNRMRVQMNAREMLQKLRNSLHYMVCSTSYNPQKELPSMSWLISSLRV